MLSGVQSESVEVQKLLIENYNQSVLSMNGNITNNNIDSRACSKPDGKVYIFCLFVILRDILLISFLVFKFDCCEFAKVFFSIFLQVSFLIFVFCSTRLRKGSLPLLKRLRVTMPPNVLQLIE